MTGPVRLPALVTGALALSLLVATHAAAEVIEHVAAVVNDQIVLLSDLRRRAAPFLEQALTGANSQNERVSRVKQLYKRLLRQLVDEELIEQASRKAHVSVTGSEVDQAIDNVRRQNQLSEDAFWQAVRAQGFVEKNYRDDVRKQLLRLKVINQRVRSRVNINEQAVRESYDDRVRDARRSQKFHAEHIFTPLPPDAPATEVARVLKEQKELRAQVTPENFTATAAQKGGGDLGWLDQGDLPAVLEDTLLSLSEGEISQPVRGPSGVHIFLLRERQSGSTKVPAFDEVKVSIQRELLDKAMQRQEELFIKNLRHDAVIDARD